MNVRSFRLAAVACVLALLCTVAPALPACPFCGGGQGQTLTKEVQQAALVVYGTLSNARAVPEPSTYLGGALALAALCWTQRRRISSLFATA